MSLTVNDPQNTWKEHRDSLTRIRSQLSDHKRSPVGSPVRRSPIRSPANRTGRNSHSPYGKYRQSTPPYLPRLETPPEHDARKQPTRLRGNRYEIVPPVKDSRKYESRNTDYDSWGEESDEDEEEDVGQYMPQPYPFQPHPYPQVVFGAPFPVYYPPPPPQPRNKKKARQNENEPANSRFRGTSKRDNDRIPLSERYEDVNSRAAPSKNSKKRSNRVHFDQTQPANGYYPYPAYPYPAFYSQPPADTRKEKRNSKYKYIDPRDTPYSPADAYGPHVQSRFRDQPEALMSYYMKDHPLFAEELVEWFIHRCLDELIPDLLIDSLNDIKKMPHLDGSPVAQVRDEVIGEVLPKMMHDVVRATLNELVDEHMLYTESERDPLESFLTRLLNDAVQEATADIVKETVKEMAHDHVSQKKFEVVYDDLLEDYMEEMFPELLEEAKLEVVAEDFIRDYVIESELKEEVPEIAKEVLSHYDSKVLRRELKEVSSQAGDKLVESIMLDYLFSLLARQGKVWTESDHANKIMDDMTTNILLEKLFDVTLHRRKTVANKPLKKLHEKCVTDVALDMLLQQLTSSLDEDMSDIDEFEQGIVNPYSTHNTPVSLLHGKL